MPAPCVPMTGDPRDRREHREHVVVASEQAHCACRPLGAPPEARVCAHGEHEQSAPELVEASRAAAAGVASAAGANLLWCRPVAAEAANACIAQPGAATQ